MAVWRRRLAISLCVAALTAILPLVAGTFAPAVLVPAAEAQTAGPASAITGIDIASWQHPGGAAINWGSVRSAGHLFAFIKATEGPTSPGEGYYTNPWFSGDWVGAGAAGLLRGAYHYAQPKADPATAIDDARHFISVTGVMNGAADLPPVLDLEEDNGLSPGQVSTWARTWLDEVQRLTGRQPIIYTGPWFWNTYVSSTAFTNYRLWIASYTSAPGPGPLPGGWPTWTIWQWASDGVVPGISGRVDVNRFCCDLSSLYALTPGGGTAAVGNPFGNFEGARRIPGGVDVSGWAIDPDTTGPVTLHAYVDGRWGGAYTADASRPDVGAAYPQYGNAHGFAVRVPLGPDARQVCLFAINTGPGNSNPRLGCRVVVSNPVGSLDAVSVAGPRQITIAGWGLDPDSTDPIDVHLYVDGRWGRSTVANTVRPDVERVYPGAGPNRGFATTLSVTPGRHQVCAYGINIGSGTDNPLFGCRTVVVPDNVPQGNLEVAVGESAGVRVSGWAVDPDAPLVTTVDFTVNGSPAGSVATSAARRDVTALYPSAPTPGFSARLPVTGSGPRTVCASARDGAGGSPGQLGCRSVVLPANPTGNVESVSQVGTRAEVVGWALDPDVTGPVTVHAYVDGRWGGSYVASATRNDVAAAYPGYSAAKGMRFLLPPLTNGNHQVCIYAINAGAGDRNPELGCRSVTMDLSPFGNPEEIRRDTGDPTKVRIEGWMLDPDAPGGASVRILVNGGVAADITTDRVRSDVGAVYPWSSGPHGFVVLVDAPTTPSTVCVIARNVGGGSDREFSCVAL